MSTLGHHFLVGTRSRHPNESGQPPIARRRSTSDHETQQQAGTPSVSRGSVPPLVIGQDRDQPVAACSVGMVDASQPLPRIPKAAGLTRAPRPDTGPLPADEHRSRATWLPPDPSTAHSPASPDDRLGRTTARVDSHGLPVRQRGALRCRAGRGTTEVRHGS